MKKLFIFDVDGVLLDLWTPMKKVFEEFHKISLSEAEWDDVIQDYLNNPAPYMKFGEYFDASEIIRDLPPIEGMPELVANLKADGFDLAIVTSISNKTEIKNKRAENLQKYYGDAFNKIICVERGGSKTEAINTLSEKYEISIFCDDHPKNVLLSRNVVTLPLWLVNKHHNHLWDSMDSEGICFVENAEEIKKIIL